MGAEVKKKTEHKCGYYNAMRLRQEADKLVLPYDDNWYQRYLESILDKHYQGWK